MQASASGNESRRKVARDCVIVNCDPHQFVNEIMVLPNSDPGSAKPKYEVGDRRLRVRLSFERRIFPATSRRRSRWTGTTSSVAMQANESIGAGHSRTHSEWDAR